MLPSVHNHNVASSEVQPAGGLSCLSFIARRQVAPRGRTVRVLLWAGVELLGQERNSLRVGRAVAPALLIRAVAVDDCSSRQTNVAQRERGPGWSSPVGDAGTAVWVVVGAGPVGRIWGGGVRAVQAVATTAAAASNDVLVPPMSASSNMIRYSCTPHAQLRRELPRPRHPCSVRGAIDQGQELSKKQEFH